MEFSHHPDLWQRFPDLVAGVLFARGVHAQAAVEPQVTALLAAARSRLQAAGSESELPEVQAWRRTFSKLGLKPTQYRCASESLLRRLKKEGDLPRIHPLIDLCNAASVAFGIPVAVLDVDRIAWPLQVRLATGQERYQAFSGEWEQPEPGEVTFADAQGVAHARRWTHRQSGLSAVREGTSGVLVVAEALHPAAAQDVPRLVDTLAGALQACWGVQPRAAVLSAAAPVFAFGDAAV